MNYEFLVFHSAACVNDLFSVTAAHEMNFRAAVLEDE